MTGSLSLRKFIVALDREDAVNQLSVWSRYAELRDTLSRGNVFDSANAARTRLAELVEQANAEGACEPGHECGRCINWPPQVWDVEISAKPVTD